jgi:hypothetical protein
VKRHDGLRPGERLLSSGELTTHFNLRMPPLVKARLKQKAVRLDERPGDMILDALYAAHPDLHPQAKGKPR